MTSEIEQLSSDIIYRNRWMTVREDKIRRSDGSDGVYGVVEKSDFAVIAAIENNFIYLVEQYRYPVSARYWELPQGSWDAGVSDPLALATAELVEETGVRASNMEHIGRLFLAYGFCTQGYDVFLANGLHEGEPQHEPEEHGLVSQRFQLAEVENMIRTGSIVDATTVATIGLLKIKGLI